MRVTIASALLVLTACGTRGDVATGATAECAFGGELTACPEAARTIEGACWRLVDCGAIAVRAGDMDDGRFDWDNCVGFLDRRSEDYQRLVIDCIAASSCDQLRVDGSPDDPNRGEMLCIQLGGS